MYDLREKLTHEITSCNFSHDVMDANLKYFSLFHL